MPKIEVVEDGLTVDQVIAELQRLCFSATDATNIVAVRRGPGLAISLDVSAEYAEDALRRSDRDLANQLAHYVNETQRCRMELRQIEQSISRARQILRNIKRHKIRPRLP